jgi:hypothetical protein
LILAAVVTGLSIWFLDSSQVIGAMAGAFLAAASAYTALDLRAIVKATGQLPAGEYAKADEWKYWVVTATMAALFVLTLVKQEQSRINLELAIGLFGPGTVGVLAILIAGMKANKAATLSKPSVEPGSV